jgi:hypothetical protein
VRTRKSDAEGRQRIILSKRVQHGQGSGWSSGEGQGRENNGRKKADGRGRMGKKSQWKHLASSRVKSSEKYHRERAMGLMWIKPWVPAGGGTLTAGQFGN